MLSGVMALIGSTYLPTWIQDRALQAIYDVLAVCRIVAMVLCLVLYPFPHLQYLGTEQVYNDTRYITACQPCYTHLLPAPHGVSISTVPLGNIHRMKKRAHRPRDFLQAMAGLELRAFSAHNTSCMGGGPNKQIAAVDRIMRRTRDKPGWIQPTYGTRATHPHLHSGGLASIIPVRTV